MEQTTLKQAADNYTDTWEHFTEGSMRASFKAGAKWQKEQYKELINLSRQLLGAYSLRYSDAKQLLAGYTNEQAFERFNQLLEQVYFE